MIFITVGRGKDADIRSISEKEKPFEMKEQKFKKQEENKKKGLIATFVFHGLAILLALFPLMSADEKQPEMQAVVIEFNSSAQSEGAKKVKKKEVQQRETRQAAALPDRASKMLTTERPNEMKVPEVKRRVKVIDAVPDPIPSNAPLAQTKSPKVIKAPKASKPSMKPLETEVAVSESAESAEGDIDGSDDGVAEAAVASGNGKGERGEGESDIGAGDSKGTGFIGGDGILSRKVVKRANINDMVKESGVIVIKLCVTQNGAVDYVEFDPSRSTIKNPDAIDGALEAMSLYRFERDMSAAERECGSFQFNIEL